MSTLRRPGGRWRLLVHEWDPDRRGYGMAHHVQPRPEPSSEHSTVHALPGTEFDELVVGRWLHIEQMTGDTWWMNIAGATVHVTADRDGRPRWIRVDGPNDYDEPVEGCRYELNWTEETP